MPNTIFEDDNELQTQLNRYRRLKEMLGILWRYHDTKQLTLKQFVDVEPLLAAYVMKVGIEQYITELKIELKQSSQLLNIKCEL